MMRAASDALWPVAIWAIVMIISLSSLAEVSVVGEAGVRTVTGELSVFIGTTPLEAR